MIISIVSVMLEETAEAEERAGQGLGASDSQRAASKEIRRVDWQLRSERFLAFWLLVLTRLMAAIRQLLSLYVHQLSDVVSENYWDKVGVLSNYRF